MAIFQAINQGLVLGNKLKKKKVSEFNQLIISIRILTLRVWGSVIGVL
jgi:hypothetical protein